MPPERRYPSRRGHKILTLSANECEDTVGGREELSDDVNKNLEQTQTSQGENPVKTSNKIVKFGQVQLFRFSIIQGFQTVPTSGGTVALGMGKQLEEQPTFHSVDEFYDIQRAENNEKISSWNRDYRSERSKNTPKKRQKTFGRKSTKRVKQEVLLLEEEQANGDVEPFYVREELRKFVLSRITSDSDTDAASLHNEDIEKETASIIESRKHIGCKCDNGNCQPDTCECALNDIGCQAHYFDEETNAYFPCTCSKGCRNPNGRKYYNQKKIKRHFTKTIKNVKKAEKRVR